MVDVMRDRRRRWPRFAVATVVLAAAIGLGPRLARAAFGSSQWPFDLHTVGTPCSDDSAWVCGSMNMPLDRAQPAGGSISVHFRILPRRHTALPSAGTVVVVNGGPGQSSIGQHALAEKAFAALLADHDLLLVDNRGTGSSGAINCPRAQHDFAPAAVAQCRTVLGSRIGDYRTVAAADDLDAILARIHADNVDIYGESYGTFFAQVFALRHPQHLRRLVLDGALPLNVDPWARDSLPTGLAALRVTCRADPRCTATGDPLALLARVLARIRTGVPKKYLSRRAYELALLVANGGRAGSAYRELPAALHAYIDGDQRPLLRLMNEARGGGFASDSVSPTADSNGLFLAVTCSDYAQPFDQRAGVAQQRRQIEASYKAAAASISHTVAPFTAEESLRGDWQCLGWPAPTNAGLQALRKPFPNVPTLVLEGGLDTVTPPPGAHSVANEFSGARYVEIPFVGHVTVFGDRTACASSIAASFLASGAVDTTCASGLAAPPHVDAFPAKFGQETPIVPIGSHRRLSMNDLRTIAITRDAVSDVLWRWARLHFISGYGLRGGTFETLRTYISGDFKVHLQAIRWTRDTTVTGDIRTDSTDDSMKGDLEISTPIGESQLEVRSAHILGPSSVETITGILDGYAVDVKVVAKLGL